MHIDIQARGFPMTDALREHTQRRLAYAMSWAGRDLTKINVRLSDVNGPRGGADKRCTISLAQGDASVVVEDTQADLYLAIDRAIERTKRALTRRLARARNLQALRHTHEIIRQIDASGMVPS